MNRMVPDRDAPDLIAAIRRLSRGAVTVIGDAMLDRYIYGTVDRVSTEAPIPVVVEQREVATPGGAGNVVRNLTAVGAAVAFVSIVGDDQAGSDLTSLIGGQPGVEPWLLVQGSRTTTVKTRYIADGQQLLRADREETAPVHPKLLDRMMRIAGDAMAATSVTVLSDYSKGLLAGDMPAQLIELARKSGRMVLVDSRSPDYTPFAGADLVGPNRRELAAATGMPVGTTDQIIAAAHALQKRLNFGSVLVTRGPDGMTLLHAGEIHHFPAEAVVVVDLSGVGDTVIATLAAGLAAGLEMPVAVRLANVAAGIVVGKPGIMTATQDELVSELAPGHTAAAGL
jgi:D-beta-D-heptose 7-phosphate kinase/D-beta-D-heptose 1-phosphate adenosyltransferase